MFVVQLLGHDMIFKSCGFLIDEKSDLIYL